ncbi:unnamed protein product [Adineta steineri]|uniref:F-box domain-containing protein n=1 Tax=Adineta steineri TaxID=433720 RepID=A0A819HN57_9BILA|nr:unnamed protein product [Adineta steineri]
MDSIKRSSSFTQFSKKKIKKLRNELSNRPITSIENLSDEIFYEIFDYIDAGPIYQIFSDLNYRFEQLLHSNLKFSHLESLNFETDDSHILMSMLSKIKSLSRLFSLTITHQHDYIDLSDIYRIILALPVLKYYKFTTNKPYLSVLLPVASNKRMNNIENLVMNHHCTFEDLSMITSYTPKLRRLYFINEKESNNLIPENIYPIPLCNLTHLTIGDYYKNFNEFEIFISQLNLNLNVLSITVQSQDITYLNATRWEEFILKYLPQLEKFYFQYSEKIHNEYEYPIKSRQLNQFSSSFWIKRQWVTKISFDNEYIIHLIRPYRETWFVDFSFTQLTLLYYPDEFGGITTVDCRRILNTIHIYHLEIRDEKIFAGLLIEMINFLPKLDSLKIHALSFNQSGSLSINELNTLCSIGNTCQITKIYLEKMIDIEEVYLLMKLCPCMTYLKVGYINKNKIKLILRNILKKINHKRISQLHSLCFHVPAIDDKIVNQLEELINNENLLFNFTIKRVFDNIHLKWT